MPPKTATRKWKPPKGPKNTPHKNKNVLGLGRQLAHSKIKKNEAFYLPSGEMQFTTEKHEPDYVKLQSVTQENPLEEFLSSAELQDKEFSAERTTGVRIIRVANQQVQNSNYNPYLLTDVEESAKFKVQKEHEAELTVPRRPAWDEHTTKEQLEQNEKSAFLEWRRQLAVLQQDNDLLLTPFERNLNLWKQLWRVVERSDLVVQIVDARNPLLFRSSDLAKYVKEVDSRKRNLLLVNKSDLLTYSQRVVWAKYFKKNNIQFTFFSAAKANEILEKQREEAERLEMEGEVPAETEELDQDLEDELDDDEKEELAKLKAELAELEGQMDDLGIQEEEKETDSDESSSVRILTVEELEQLFLSVAPEPLAEPVQGRPQRTQIGLVGYPNVGKSSTINALVGSKKVSVSSTPGKTKHYQTILLSDKVVLCDCPGLVFPNFAYTNAELVCNGVLPIDQLRECTGPTELVCRRIPKYFLEAMYGITIRTRSTEEGGTGIPTASEFLSAYGIARGYMTAGYGVADENRAARYILKDYVNGKLLYVEPPCNADGSRASDKVSAKFNEELYTFAQLPEYRRQFIANAVKEKGLSMATFRLQDIEKVSLKVSEPLAKNKTARQRQMQTAAEDLDDEFFQMNSVKGVLNNPFHKKKAVAGSKKHNKKMNRRK